VLVVNHLPFLFFFNNEVMERLVHTDTASLTDHVATNASDQLTAYLARLGWSSSSPSCALPPPTLDTLRGLHGLHVRHVTFENLDLHCGRHIYLDLPTLFAKIVERRRGGFCFEVLALPPSPPQFRGAALPLCSEATVALSLTDCVISL
jgi:N-hydroxyarylamine O-acetyltransferase